MSSFQVFSVIHAARSLVFCLMFCRLCISVLFLLAIVLSGLQFTASDINSFGIFKHVLQLNQFYQGVSQSCIFRFSAIKLFENNLCSCTQKKKKTNQRTDSVYSAVWLDNFGVWSSYFGVLWLYKPVVSNSSLTKKYLPISIFI